MILRAPVRPLALAALAASITTAACGGKAEPATVAPEDGPTELSSTPQDSGPLVFSEYSAGGVLKGLLTRAEGTVDPPVGSKIKVGLWAGQGESKIVLEREIEVTGPAPWAFEMVLEESAYDPHSTYGISATLTDPGGDIWFLTRPVLVFQIGVPQGAIELVFDPMDARATGK
ncbi:MAG: YbaY family lipoprotein [Myxococcales bacterium]|nr:YbaY family lipoprotein [Myxococcales bacterium]MCB9701939.1 YbaY family lipoprotein [Myxococcales bacterium]